MAVNQKRRFNDASEQAESEENSQNSFAFTDKATVLKTKTPAPRAKKNG